MNRTEQYEEEALLDRVVSNSSAEQEDDTLEYELDELEDVDIAARYGVPQRPRWWRPLRRGIPRSRGQPSGSSYLRFHSPRRRRSLACRIAQILALVPYVILSCIVICGIFFPSYSHPPQRYLEIRSRVLERGQTANINNEKIFIAASLYDHEGELLAGEWGQSVLHLIDILGPTNVFLSVYENDPDHEARQAMNEFAKNVTCHSSLVAEHVDLSTLPHVTTMDGSQRLKRIAFLADVRNRALRPLENSSSLAFTTRFDKVLYLNDIIFDPIDAANLLFSTNVNEQTGRTQYRAACAMDFINPFKFYDTFATRDLEGYESGVIFYPWFTHAGEAHSRKDVIQQKDAVRVKSCWGGMVAFEARWFQPPTIHRIDSLDSASSGSADNKDHHMDTDVGLNLEGASSLSNTSIRFRADADTYWDSSECCLIHADLAAMEPESLAANDTGIYMNPYIRVAYSPLVLPWLSFTRRFERLYTPINTLVNWIAGKPRPNERQFEQAGQEVIDRVWKWDPSDPATPEIQGHFEDVHRKALPGGFCGMRKLLYINEHPEEGDGKKWVKELIPEGLRRES